MEETQRIAFRVGRGERAVRGGAVSSEGRKNPTEPADESPNVAGVIANTGEFFDQLSHREEGPLIRIDSGIAWASKERGSNLTRIHRIDPRSPSARFGGLKALHARGLPKAMPLHRGRPRDSQLTRDLRLADALLKELARSRPKFVFHESSLGDRGLSVNSAIDCL